MKKDVIRREAIKLRYKGKTYPAISLILEERYQYKVSSRTLRRWNDIFQNTNWNFKDKSKRPHTVFYKFSFEYKQEAIKIRKLTGWDAKRIKKLFEKHGKPREILTDNGPEFKNEFDNWCKKHGIVHIRSALN